MKKDNLGWLVKPAIPLPPEKSLAEVGDLFLQDDYGHLLSLPVVDGNMPVGMISRYTTMQMLMKLYGRELHGKRKAAELMNPKPVIVDLNQSLESAAQHIIQNISFPVTEDFILVEDGHYVGVGVVLDVLNAMEKQVAGRNAELARTLEELKSSQAQLIQSEKMASLGQMVAGVAHEMNTPLGYVRSNVEIMESAVQQVGDLLMSYEGLVALLLEKNADPLQLEERFTAVAELSQEINSEMFGDYQGLVKDTLFGVDQLSGLVNNLRNFSRLDQANTDNINLNDAIDSVLMIARNGIKHLNIVRESEELPDISCAPSQINQVFLNMINNAAQAIDGDGEIRIKSWSDSGYVYVSIEDDGKGIPEDELTKIFDPFFTTKKIGEGTGLGLSIAYKIVQEHGGNIHVSSVPAEGTVFTVSLPRKLRNLKKAV